MKLKVNEKNWCWWVHRYLWYRGRAYNAKDYEFEDAGDFIITLNAEQVEKLERR